MNKIGKNLHVFSHQQINVLWWAKGGIFVKTLPSPSAFVCKCKCYWNLKVAICVAQMGLCYVHLFYCDVCSSDFRKMFGMTPGHDRILPKLESGSKYLTAIRLCHMSYTYSWPGKESARVLNVCRYSIKMSASDTHWSGFCLPHI